MFRNYLTAALRNLARNKLYASINIVGLAVGFAAAILIALFVRDELSFDGFIPGHEQIYLVSPIFPRTGRAPMQSDLSPPDLAAWLKLDFPPIQAVTRLASDGVSLRHGNIEAEDKIGWADANFFSLIPLPVFAGDIKDALTNPNGIVVTRKMARKYFGRDNAVGQTLELGSDRHLMQVMAVLEDLPSNTHLNTEIFASGNAAFSMLKNMDEHPQPSGSFLVTVMTYVKLAPGTSSKALLPEFPDFLVRHKKLNEQDGTTLELIPLADIHLHPRSDFMMKDRGSLATIRGVIAIGFLIVLIASINFVNLMTTVAGSRAVEVSIRKVAGARRRDLVVQFIGESLVYAALATLLSIVIVELLLPPFNSYFSRTISLWSNSTLIIWIGLLGMIVGALAGIYPAVVLSAFRPVGVLKSSAAQTVRSTTIRKALIVLQFAILIGLIAGTAVIYRQTTYATNAALRFDTQNVLLVSDSGHCGNTVKDALQQLPGVGAVACSSFAPTNNGKIQGPVTRPNGLKTNIFRSPVDVGFFELYGLPPLAGRLFSKDRAGDALAVDKQAPMAASVVINETAVIALGFTSPKAAIGQFISLTGIRDETRPSEIIGIVPDFPVDSIRNAVDPTVFFVDQNYFQLINIKLTGQNIPETLRGIGQLLKQLGSPGPLKSKFLSQYLHGLYQDIEKSATVFAGFSIVAILICCLGMFGLAMLTAQRRTKELGIRKALGASGGDVMRLLLWQFTKPVLWANLIAWPIAAFVMNRWLHSFAYHIDLELWLFVAATVLAMAIALLTVSAHCYFIARAKPITALRYE